VLTRVLDDFEELWSGVPRPQLTRRERITELEQPVVDAQQSALRFFTPRWISLEPVEDAGGPTETAARYALMAVGTENDYIKNDASVFLDWEAVPGATHGWFEFRSGDRQLLVKNISVSTVPPRLSVEPTESRGVPERDPNHAHLVGVRLHSEGGRAQQDARPTRPFRAYRRCVISPVRREALVD
jgi:hypothetical protein